MTDQIQPAEAPKYARWKRPMTYVIFGLGLLSVLFLTFCVMPSAIVMGWFALGCGLPAVILGAKEVKSFPEAAEVGMIKWGRRTGLIGTIGGPATAIIWIVLLAIGVNP